MTDTIARALALLAQAQAASSRAAADRAPPKLQAVATRVGMIGGTGPGATALTDGIVTSATYRITHYVRADAAVQDIVLRYANYEASLLYNGAAGEIDGPSSITVKAAIEYGGKTYPLRFNGARNAVILPGAHVDTDPLGIDLPAGATFFERVYVSVVSGGKWPVGMDRLASSSVVDYTNVGGDGSDVVDALGAITTASGSTPRMYHAIGIWGTVAADRAASGLIIGDSIGAGVGDTTGDALGNNGFIKRALSNKVGWIEHTRSGYELRNWDGQYAGTPGGHYRGILLSRGASFVIFELGTNDLYNGAWANLAQAQTFYLRAWAQLRARGLKVYQTTITPQTTSSNGWVDPAGQTAKNGNTIRTQLNDWFRTKPTGLDGVLEVTDLVEPFRNAGVWKGGYTTDGVHPVASVHQIMATAIPISSTLGLAP